jgi:alpha-galactosidase
MAGAVHTKSHGSGGGRIDYVILARKHRVWLSEGKDARTLEEA